MNGAFSTGVLGLVVLLLSVAALGSAAAPTGTQSITSRYGTVTCYADAIVVPQSTLQLAEAIKQLGATSKAAGKQLKIRASRRCVTSPAMSATVQGLHALPVASEHWHERACVLALLLSHSCS